jgi:membrane protease YdiL (CAAX protease family)
MRRGVLIANPMFAANTAPKSLGSIDLAQTTRRYGPAPFWHTVLMLAYVLVPVSAVPGGKRLVSALLSAGHPWIYVVDMYWQWIGCFIMLFGLAKVGVPVSALVGSGGQARKGLGSYVMTATAAWLLAIGLTLSVYFLFGPFERNPYRLMPTSPLELAVFLPLSVTAGICEELIFRGYFLMQFTTRTHSTLAAICIQAAAFSVAHGLNQTIAGFSNKFLIGFLFGVLAVNRRSLIPGMVAHAWLDLSGGILSVLIAH